MFAATAFRALAVAACCAASVPATAQQSSDLAELRRHALDLVNNSRSGKGLPRLDPGPALNDAAQGHSVDMMKRDYYSHVTPDGKTPHDRFLEAGGSRWEVSGENIARCTGCDAPPDMARVEAFHDGWMQSPDHRANILSQDFDRMGFGIAGQGREVYAVQTFAGAGQSGNGASLAPQEAREAALEAVNVRRDREGLAALEASTPLDAVAKRILDARLAGEAPTQNIFALLPEGATGWTSIAIRSGSRGGSGRTLTGEAVSAFVEQWFEADDRSVLGGERAAYFGFAAAAREDGRSTAVAVFGARD